MYTILLVIQVLVAIGLIALILMQHGKGADAGAAFGSGASATVFGARGSASFLSRATAVLATIFFAVSLALAILANRQAHTAKTGGLVPGSAPAAQVPAKTSAPAASDKTAPASDVPAAPTKAAPPASTSDVPAPTPSDNPAPAEGKK